MPRPRTADEVRTLVAREVAIREIPPIIWERRNVQEFVDEYLADPSGTRLQEIVDEVRDRLNLIRYGMAEAQARTASVSPPGGITKLPVQTATEWELAEAHGAWCAKEAGGRDDVRAFRREILNDQLLVREEAEAWVTRRDLAVLTTTEYRFLAVAHGASAAVEKEEVPTPSREAQQARQAQVQAYLATFLESGTIHIFRTPSGWRWFVAIPDSVLDRLLRLSECLRETYGWDSIEAMFFVLTGQVGAPSSVVTQVQERPAQSHYTEITLRVAPWISAKTVGQNYRLAQRDFFPGGYRPTSARNIRVFRFVLPHLDSQGRPTGGYTWQRLMVEWNQHCADRDYEEEWRYRDWRRFRGDYRRVLDDIHPPMKWSRHGGVTLPEAVSIIAREVVSRHLR